MDFAKFKKILSIIALLFNLFYQWLILLPILKYLASNEYTIKDSFIFPEEIDDKDSEFFLQTFHCKRLLTYVLRHFFENTERVEGLKIEFKELLSLATRESYFIFNGELYKDVEGVAMASPLDRTLSNAFLKFFWKELVTKLSLWL